jgi:signal transduction histidine kinase
MNRFSLIMEDRVMNLLRELALFEMIPQAERTPEQQHWWNQVRRGKSVPYPFGRGIRIASDVMLLCVAILIGVTNKPGVQPGTFMLMELLFLSMCAGLLIARTFKHLVPAATMYLVVVALAIPLDLAFPGAWGSIGLYSLCFILLYAFPLRWSLPLAGVCVLALVATNGLLRLLLPPPSLPLPPAGDPPGILLFSPLLAGTLGWIGWVLRTQYLLVVQLHEVQEQLREHMARSEELATERERTRIARDIHDVLSHSLAVLSIQVQALRPLAARRPEQVGAKLDDMAAIIRESISESRRVVGLLREKPPAPGAQEKPGASLRALALTFNERTGISCHFAESGTLHQLHSHQQETLQLALRELLTNAHRHGAAQTVWITLRWREASLIMTVSDDGRGAKATPLDAFAQKSETSREGHHGLQGMRERLEALGGEVEAQTAETGGFIVTLRLPFAFSHEPSARKERTA